jgi:hypothetical protein
VVSIDFRGAVSCTISVEYRSVLKKLFNPIDSLSRRLFIGKYLISSLAMDAAYANDRVGSGIRFTDLRQSRNKQNVPPILRICSEVSSNYCYD